VSVHVPLHTCVFTRYMSVHVPLHTPANTCVFTYMHAESAWVCVRVYVYTL